MGADLSRIRSNPLLDFAGVELKQGGVVLDADFNEMVAIVDRRLRAAASDILGRSTVSSTTPDAFKITAVAGGLSIGKGRLYVDGLLAENHGVPSTDPAKKLFDGQMAEVSFADLYIYATQPYLPSPPTLPEAGRHLVYLDVWDREVTHIERPSLVEVAVGVETSSRRQTVWQVRVLDGDTGNATCGSPDEDVPGWSALIAPSTGRLTTGTFDVPPSDDPCELPPTGGYRGIENQTYRVEIHDPGQPGAGANFKWSRENASVGSRVASMVSATELELDSLGRDDVLRFNSDDWVEITGDPREFSQRCGEIRKITVNEAARRITFTPALPADMLPAAFPSSDFPRDCNLRVRRWDQKHEVLQTGAGGTTSVFQDLDTGTSGVINVPAAGSILILENGVTVSFGSTGAKGFKAGDYWVFAARSADASVEILSNEPPRGIYHHYERLGIWDVGADTVTDCRHPWPPRGEGHDCSCIECVTRESHNSGQFTIQDAVDRLRDTGGTVCLTAGQYQLKVPVQLNGARAVRIRGQGAATLIVTPGGAFSIANCIALAIEDMAILSLGRTSAISVRTALGLSLQRLVVAVLGSNDARGAGIALSGAVAAAVIRDNVIVAPVAVQAMDPAAPPEPKPLTFLLSALLRIDDNLLWCDRQAVALAGNVLHLMGTRINGNEIIGCRQGAITALGFCGPGASMKICNNSINVSGTGITAGVDGLWIEGNKLTASVQSTSRVVNGSGISLRTGLDPDGANECQILANQISGFEEAGIAVTSPTRALIIKLNIIQQCGNGIVSLDEARANEVSIENNHIADIGSARADAAAEIVGVGVLRAEAATVAGNTIRRVGLTALTSPLRAGVASTGVQRLRVSGNDVTDIAPPGSFETGIGAGVLLRPPFVQAEVSHNQVDRESQTLTQGGGRFITLQIDDPRSDQAVSKIGVYTTVRVDANTTLILGAKRPFINRATMVGDATGTPAASAGAASVSVLGNTLGSRGTEPTVRVVASGDCLFGDNRCELRGVGNAAVQLAAGATIVNANRVRGGEHSIVIRGNTKNATVLGNITTGNIDLINGGLPAPWDVLNLRG
ncbi:MAG: right-handed parallel beta-helix repeat-containing protein [Betaproteobacteria bacterium]|nr:right-handed parallel beta-helix repeat-containing protein [Betaproteobacteria bacterium]